MKRVLFKFIGTVLCLALFVQLFIVPDAGFIRAKAKETDKIEYDSTGCGYIGKTLVSVPKNLTSVKVRKGTETIANSVFSGNDNIQSVKLPESLKKIGEYAFADTPNLEKITLPDNLKKIGGGAFCGSGIKAIVIPKKVTVIEYSVFYGCENLKEVELKGKVTKIKELAFYNTPKLKKIIIRNGLEKIGFGAFENCGFESLKLPCSVSSIADDAFRGTNGNITVPAGCRGYRMYKNGMYTRDFSKMIAYPKNLSEVTIHPECESVAPYVFDGSEITELYIPKGVKELNKGAFCGCKKLKKVKIGRGLTELMYKGVLCYCPSLKEVTVCKYNKDFSSYNECIYTKDYKSLVYVPEGIKDVKMHGECTNFSFDFICGSYYHINIYCSDYLQDVGWAHFELAEGNPVDNIYVRAGTETAYRFAEKNGEIKYTLTDNEDYILENIYELKRDIMVKKGKKATPEYYVIEGLYRVSDEKDMTTNASYMIEWSSSDENIAVVSKNGIIKGVNNGSAVITAVITLQNHKQTELYFNVGVI